MTTPKPVTCRVLACGATLRESDCAYCALHADSMDPDEEVQDLQRALHATQAALDETRAALVAAQALHDDALAGQIRIAHQAVADLDRERTARETAERERERDVLLSVPFDADKPTDYRALWHRDVRKGTLAIKERDGLIESLNASCVAEKARADAAEAERDEAHGDLAATVPEMTALRADRDTAEASLVALRQCVKDGNSMLGHRSDALWPVFARNVLARPPADLAACVRARYRREEREHVISLLRARAARASSAGATCVGLDGEIVRMHAAVYQALTEIADSLEKL